MESITPLFELKHHFESRKQAMDQLQQKAFEYGFDVTISDSHNQDVDNDEDKKRSYFVLSCIHGKNRSGETPKVSKKMNCPFMVRVKDHVIKVRGNKEAVWMITKMTAKHNHELLTQDQMSAYPKFRALDEKKTFVCIEMFNANVPNKTIAEHFTDYSKNEIYLAKDAANLRAKFNTLSGATQEAVAPFLKEMEECGYSVSSAYSSGVLTHLFFFRKENLKLIEKCPEVMIVDATYKTNHHEFPLISAVGISNTSGKHNKPHVTKDSPEPKTALMNYQIALAWVANESETSYNWFFEKIKNIYLSLNVYPEVIITDRGKSVVNAAESKFPTVKKMFCAWHIINNNLEVNCKKHFELELHFDRLQSLVWALQSSKTEDIKTRNLEFCRKFVELKSSNAAKVCTYLDSLMKIDQQWVRCYVDKYPHMGTYTTGRGESQHAAIKIGISSLSSLQQAFKEITKVLEKQAEHQRRATGINKTTFLAHENVNLFKELHTKVSMHALKMIKIQLLLHGREEEEKIESTCSGQFTSVFKLPCRHTMDLQNAEYSIPLESVGSRWRLTSATEPDIPTVSLGNNFQSTQQPVPAKLTSVLYKLEAVISNEPLESNQLDYISYLETFCESIVSKSSQNNLLPSQPTSSQKSQQGNSQKLKKEKRDLLHVEKVRLESEKTRLKYVKKDQKNKTKEGKSIKQPSIPEAVTRNVPTYILPYVKRCIDVTGDGNCGFRAVAIALGLSQECWPQVRIQLRKTLENDERFFRSEFPYDYEDMLTSFQWEKGSCLGNHQHYMIMPYTAYVIAEAYCRPVSLWSAEGSYTVLPRTPLGSACQFISLVLDTPRQYDSQRRYNLLPGHYLYLDLHDDSPLPPINPINESMLSKDVLAHCKTMFGGRLQAYQKLHFPTTNTTTAYVDLTHSSTTVSANPIPATNPPNELRIIQYRSDGAPPKNQLLSPKPLQFTQVTPVAGSSASANEFVLPIKRKLLSSDTTLPSPACKRITRDIQTLTSNLSSSGMEDEKKSLDCFVCCKDLALKCGFQQIPGYLKKIHDEISRLVEEQKERKMHLRPVVFSRDMTEPKKQEYLKWKEKQAIDYQYQQIKIQQLQKQFCEKHTTRRFLGTIEKYDCSVINFSALIDDAMNLYSQICVPLLTRSRISPYEINGKNFTKNPHATLLSAANISMSGYFGQRGEDVLVNIFCRNDKVLADYSSSKLKLQTQFSHMQYIKHILVPEVFIAFYQQKYSTGYENACKIIHETKKIGAYFCKSTDEDEASANVVISINDDERIYLETCEVYASSDEEDAVDNSEFRDSLKNILS